MTSIIKGNNSEGSFLEPLLKEVTPIVGSRMLCWFSVVIGIVEDIENSKTFFQFWLSSSFGK
jgi:hypothetical protein